MAPADSKHTVGGALTEGLFATKMPQKIYTVRMAFERAMARL
jgi:hypothetical protein